MMTIMMFALAYCGIYGLWRPAEKPALAGNSPRSWHDSYPCVCTKILMPFRTHLDGFGPSEEDSESCTRNTWKDPIRWQFLCMTFCDTSLRGQTQIYVH